MVVVLGLLFSTAVGAEEASRPNILFVLTDNTGWGDFGAYGGGELRGAPTPQIDRMAREGLLLLNFNTEPSARPAVRP